MRSSGRDLAPALAALLTLVGVGCDRREAPDPRPGEAPDPGSAQVAAPAAAEAQPTADRVQRELSPSGGPLLSQLSQHATEAHRRGLTPVLYAHASWCPPCNAVARYADDPSMREAFAGTYIVGVDVDAWGDQLSPHQIGGLIPMWVALEADGRPGGRRIDGGAWGEDVPANMAGPLGTFFHSL